MAKVELTELTEPTPEEPLAVIQAVGPLLMSVLFWTSLLVSLSMYAAVALSPKVAGWISVRQQYVSNAARLKELEDEIDYLERVAAALKTDPEFARQLVQADLPSTASDAEFVPVSKDLLFGGSTPNAKAAPQVVQPAFAAVVFHLAGHQQHRSWLLAAASALTLIGFTLLNDAGTGIMYSVIKGTGKGLSFVTSRYRKPPVAAENE